MWRVLLALMLLPALPLHACSKSVRWYDDPPYSFRGPDGQIMGIDAEVTREALRRVGCKAAFVEMPWARALAELKSGRLDILPGTFRSTEREAFALFSIPSVQSPNILYTSPKARSQFRLTRMEDMLGTKFRLGVQIGVSYGDKFEALKSDPQFKHNQVPVTLRRAAWKMMELGRIDGMIADEASAILELEQLGLAGTFKPGGIIVSTNTAMTAFSRHTTSQEFVRTFNVALKSMLLDGGYRRIRERYVPCPRDGKLLGCT